MKKPDPSILRLATRIAALQGITPLEVRVPRDVAIASQDLHRTNALARKVLRNDRVARREFIARLGGDGALPADRRYESRPMSARSAALMAAAQRGPIRGGPCQGRVRGDLELLEAAFRLDADNGFRDARLTTRAMRFVRERRDKLAEFAAGPARATDRVATVRDNRVPGGARGQLPGGGKAGGPKGGFGPGIVDPDDGLPKGGAPADRAPLFPPDVGVPDVIDPPEPGVDPDLCLELGDLCIQLFNDFAVAALAEDDAQLIASVEPSCLGSADFDDTTVFTARPDMQRPFPAQRGDYRLIFRGGDITARIVNWAPQQIQFTIPANSATGYLYLQRPLNSISNAIGQTLGNLCGVPNLGTRGMGLSPSPRAIISIVHPPVVESFAINRSGANSVTTEACTAVTFRWAVRLADQQLGQLLPPCCTIEVDIQSEHGNILHHSTDEVGTWVGNPAATDRYRIVARSFAGQRLCGEAISGLVELVREHALYLTPNDPSSPSIVAGLSGILTVSTSCPAPPGGTRVQLLSSDPNVLQVPAFVSILPGERAAPVQFGTTAQAFGNATVTARLANHREATLQYRVLENLTAIVLSGGGAKGSFEVGALLYLREIWNDVKPRIVCSTSVGSINALAVAESLQSNGIDKLEGVWLGLRTGADMYAPSPELAQGLAAIEITFDDFIAVLSEVDGATIDVGFWNIVDEGAAAGWFAAGWAFGGPIGGIIAGIASLASDAADSLSELQEALANASFLLDLAPARQTMEALINRQSIANSGMKLRMAAVALEDGELYYVTEQSRLFRSSAATPDLDEPITTADPLIVGALASSAIPGVFPAVRIATASAELTYVDGGVREVLPSFAAVELGAQLLFNISASTSDPHVENDAGYNEPGKLLTIMKRGVDLQGNEVVREEMHPRAGFADRRERVLIHPAFEVHNLIQIDPGLIRINIAYGYFRAFDGDQKRRGNINSLQYLLWRAWTDELIMERLRCHQAERRLAPWLANMHAQLHDTLQSVRGRKNRIAELMVERFSSFGPDAFPRKLRHNAVGDQGTLDWCRTWELHDAATTAALAGVDLWAAQVIAPGTAAGDGPGHPWVRESDVVPQFPLPPLVVNGLQNR